MKPRKLPPGVVRGRARITPEVRAEREALALTLLRAGETRRDVAARSKLCGSAVTALADREGIPPDVRAAKVHNQIPDAERERRHAHALELLRQGLPRGRVMVLATLSASAVKAIAEQYGIARLQAGPRRMHDRKDVTAMTDAELDALETRVAADRASGVLPPIEPYAPTRRTYDCA